MRHVGVDIDDDLAGGDCGCALSSLARLPRVQLFHVKHRRRPFVNYCKAS